MKFDTVIIALLTSLFALIGVVIGSYLSHKSSIDLFYFRKDIELRERSYSKLLGLEIAWNQAMQTCLEAEMLTEFYDARYLQLSHNAEDLKESMKQNDRKLALIPRVSDIQREIFETLGDIRISYKIDEKINASIEAIFKFQTLKINAPGQVKNDEDLEKWKNTVNLLIHDYLNKEIKQKIGTLIRLLEFQLRRDFKT